MFGLVPYVGDLFASLSSLAGVVKHNPLLSGICAIGFVVLVTVPLWLPMIFNEND